MARLGEPERAAFICLGVFAEDLAVPVEALTMLWPQVANGPHAVQRLCERLDGLSLLASYHRGAGTIRVHDVVRAFLQFQYPAEVRAAHQALIVAARALVPVGPALTSSARTS